MSNYQSGGSGWSGTSTSEAAEPVRGAVQGHVLTLVRDAGYQGLTVAEARIGSPGLHHGSVSSALTNLHRAGRIVRLADVRYGCKVYVVPSQVYNRRVEPPTTRQRRPLDEEALRRDMTAEVADALGEGYSMEFYRSIADGFVGIAVRHFERMEGA